MAAKKAPAKKPATKRPAKPAASSPAPTSTTSSPESQPTPRVGRPIWEAGETRQEFEKRLAAWKAEQD